MAITVRLYPELEHILKDRNDIVISERIGDYINDEFFLKYTKFKSYDEFILFSPYTEEELANDSLLFESDKMNRYIELTTPFVNYENMFEFALNHKLLEKVGVTDYE